MTTNNGNSSTATSTASTTGNTVTTEIRPREITLERTFDAPRELVFAAWSQPEHLANWWGPKEWTLPVCQVDFRPGGSWLYCMRAPDGTEAWGGATYREIVPPERIVMLDSFVDSSGTPLPDFPQTLMTFEFIALGDKTKVRSISQFASEADLQQLLAMQMVEGLTASYERLDDYLFTKGQTMNSRPSTLTLPSEREVSMSRVFDAPRDLLFRTLTDPSLVPQWWGRGTYVDKYEFHVGGAWRFVQRDPSGAENGFRGEIREITPPERLVQTFEWEGMPGHIIVETMVLEDIGGGKTRLVTTSLFNNQEDRDGMMSTGMEQGASESWDRLATLLEEQKAKQRA